MTIKAAIEYAIRSTEMENGPISADTRELMQRVVIGEITLKEIRELTTEKARKLANKGNES